VPIEAEIKANVDAQQLRAALAERAAAERSTYHDRYFDHPTDAGPRTGTSCASAPSPTMPVTAERYSPSKNRP